MKIDRKKVLIAVVIAAVIVLPWMLLGGDAQTGHAFDDIIAETGAYQEIPSNWEIDCWWDFFCFGFCNC